MKTNLLDCTLRDGGYYNNWQFSKTDIQNYINEISKIGIQFIEIGFLFLPMDKKRGPTAHCDKKFFKSFKFPKNINFGIMINAADLINFSNQKDEKEKLRTLKNLKYTNIKFIRIACHFNEVFKIEKYLKVLKKNKKVNLFINIMQISEIETKNIYKICNFSKKYFKCLYIADSLGSLKKKQIKFLINQFKKNWPYEMGIHAHDNQSLALENTLFANRNGLNWLDSTITGMGRGPGNTKTEELIKFFKDNRYSKNKAIKNLLKIFLKLKKKYKWGTNEYYRLSGKYKIHPSYIQTMLSDPRYEKSDYMNAIKYLKNKSAKSFNPYTLLSAFNIYEFKNKVKLQNQNYIFKNKQFNQALILGPGRSLKKIKYQLNNKIKKSNLLVICLNNTKIISDKLIDIRAFCHPIKILSNLNYFKNSSNNLLIPYSCLSKNLQSSFNKHSLIDFGIKIGDKTSIHKTYVSLKKPLALVYALSFLISKNIKKIYLAGFDGYALDEPNQDESFEMIEDLKKKYSSKNFNFFSLSKTKLNIKKVNLNKIEK